MIKRFPAKANTLAYLRSIDLPVGTVLDVGAHEQTEELRLSFPDKKHILFEPAIEFHEKLHQNYAAINYELHHLALSDSNGEGYLRTASIDGGDVSHATLVESSDHLGTDVVVPTRRLDSFLSSKSYERPYLLKIDVDGFEVPILKGASGVAEDISCLIVEATTSTLADRLNTALELGLELFDVIDQCYYYGVMSQVDLVFLSSKVMKIPDLRPWETKPFSWNEWLPIASLERAANAGRPGEG